MLVVTADGKLIRTRQCTRKSSTGYDINQLYIGSEGTLGAIVELVVKIYPIMPVRVGCLVKFDQVADAARGVIGRMYRDRARIIDCGVIFAATRTSNMRFPGPQPHSLPAWLLRCASPPR